MTARDTNPWLVLCLVCIAQFMVVLDATIVNVTGFHGAFLGGAVFFVAGIAVMLTLLKHEDVAQVDTDRPLAELAA